MVRQPDATVQATPQDNPPMSKHPFSASSRNFELNGQAKARTKQNSPIIPPV